MDQDELKRTLGEHSKWLESDTKQGSRASFSGKELRAVELVNKDLRLADFTTAGLGEAQ